MIKSKYINVIVAIAVCFSLITSILLIGYKNVNISSNTVSEPEYKSKLFGTDIVSVDILVDENEWQQMLDNAMNEEYIMVDVVINGTKFENIGIRPKGNSSLSQVSQYDNNRYSFRLQFDEYIKDQTCFGLDSFVVNNMLGDNTYMKEYVSYDLMSEIGVNSPYFSFADIKVNGDSFGFYLAVETYGESYERRVSGDTSGMLYNVKSMEMGNNKNQNEKFPNMPERGNMPNDEKRPNNMNMQNNKNLPNDMSIPNSDKKGAGGGSLEYTDDNVSSYSSIFNNVIGKGTDNDYQKVIEALKALSEGKELEKYFSIDNILRYLAAHTIVVNLDSYSSSMAQNYYIYEKDGKIDILPWDYNLAWGGFQSGDASSVINFPINTPVSGVEMSTRPIIEKLFSNTEYLNKYHNYLQELIDKYFADGKFAEKINELNSLISEYVKNDKTSFCTYDEYNTAILSFIRLGNLRAESIQGQLDGIIPSTTEGQKANQEALISSDDLNLSELGTMKGRMNGDFKDREDNKDNFSQERPNMIENNKFDNIMNENNINNNIPNMGNLQNKFKNTSEEANNSGHIIFEKEGLKVDITAYKVFVDGIQVDLAPKEYDLLFFLIRNKNIAIPRERIITEVWGYDYFGDDRTLDTHIKLLRKSLCQYASFITTLRGLGYRFEG